MQKLDMIVFPAKPEMLDNKKFVWKRLHFNLYSLVYLTKIHFQQPFEVSFFDIFDIEVNIVYF